MLALNGQGWHEHGKQTVGLWCHCCGTGKKQEYLIFFGLLRFSQIWPSFTWTVVAPDGSWIFECPDFPKVCFCFLTWKSRHSPDSPNIRSGSQSHNFLSHCSIAQMSLNKFLEGLEVIFLKASINFRWSNSLVHLDSYLLVTKLKRHYLVFKNICK